MLEAMGWSRIPSCPWMVSDGEGVPRCSYGPVRDRLKPLEAARFTVFNQSFIDEAIASECTPKSCPSRWNRFLNSLYPIPRHTRGPGAVSRMPLESEASCNCGAPRKPMVGLDGVTGMFC